MKISRNKTISWSYSPFLKYAYNKNKEIENYVYIFDQVYKFNGQMQNAVKTPLLKWSLSDFAFPPSKNCNIRPISRLRRVGRRGAEDVKYAGQALSGNPKYY